MMQNDKTTERGNFVQYPCQLIYNCPNLNRDDRWALLAIMGVCWTEEFYKLSYRDVSKLSGIPLSMLSSITGKDGKPDKEGIMDRLKRLEYIYCALGKELNSATGKPRGNAQTYIKVNYTKIWAESILYKITPYSPQKDFEPVSYTNRLTERPNQPVSYTNAPVSYTNTSVPHANRPVSYTNAPVRDLSVNLPPYITYTNIDNLDKTDRDTFVASATPPPDFSKTICYPFEEHPFIGLDNEHQPTLMIVTLTPAFPHPYYSEMEDKRRERIAAWEVLPTYKKQGLEVEVRWEHETERQTVDAATTIVESTAVVGGNHITDTDNMPLDYNAIPESPCSATDGLTQESAIIPRSETTPSESQCSATESTSSTQAVKDLSNQATEQGQQASNNSYSPKKTTNNQPAQATLTLVPDPLPAKQARKSRNQQPTKETQPAASKKPEITLSPEAQFVFDEWCKLPWFKAKPELTATTAGHCETLAPYKPTVDIMLKVKNWATSKAVDRNGYYRGKGWNLKFFLNELPKWLSMQPNYQDKPTTATSSSEYEANETTIRQDYRSLLRNPTEEDFEIIGTLFAEAGLSELNLIEKARKSIPWEEVKEEVLHFLGIDQLVLAKGA